MATINACSGIAYGVPTAMRGLGGYVLANEIDMDALGVASGDTIYALPIVSKSAVLYTEIEIVTPSNAATSASAKLGDGSDDDGYIASANLKSSAGTVIVSAGTEAYVASGRRYTTDSYVTLTPTYSGTTTVKGKVKVRAFCVKIDADSGN